MSINRLLRGSVRSFLYTNKPLSPLRKFHHVPFHDDLTPADENLFNLEDFQNYKESPEVKAYREKLGIPDAETDTPNPLAAKYKPDVELDKGTVPNGLNLQQTQKHAQSQSVSFEQLATQAKPAVFISRLSDPFLNLAIEDYIYNRMPLPRAGQNCNRLVFYVNSPCVVVGKNQNPWKEVNMPLLTELKIPLVRRRSGGGTVVHDMGNVNYSFMTTKEKFDRFTFADLVVQAVNSIPSIRQKITVNERGDIVTSPGGNKVSGSAYKLSKGRSYHHGTMLLDLKLDVLRKLLHRDESQLGQVISTAAVKSVKSPVANLHIPRDEFMNAVVTGFQERFGSVSPEMGSQIDSETDQTDLLGLRSFVDAYSDPECDVFIVDASTTLPPEVTQVKEELMKWEWKYGATPKFQHKLFNEAKQVNVTIDVDKNALVLNVAVDSAVEEVKDAFQFLQAVLKRGDHLKYTGSTLAGFIVDDELSEWLGNAIDGTT